MPRRSLSFALAVAVSALAFVACTTSDGANDTAAGDDAGHGSFEGGESGVEAGDARSDLDAGAADADAHADVDADAGADADADADADTGEPDSCHDGIKNGDESDVDCGGSCVARCGDEKACLAPSDCVAGASCSAGVCLSPNGGGSGTLADPWKLGKVHHLESLRTSSATSFFVLTDDIDLAGHSFSPIALFEGHLDGGGHAIKNWTYSGGVEYGDVGFIERLSDGTLSHLRLENVALTASAGYQVGGLVGSALGAARIHDCHVTGAVTATHDFALFIGGLVGNYANDIQVAICAPLPSIQGLLISNCSADVTLEASSSSAFVTGSGSILGGSGNGQVRAVIADSHAHGSNNVAVNRGGIAGGFTGGFTGLTILRSYSTVMVTSNGNGLAGPHGPYGVVTGSFWDTSASGSSTSDGAATGLDTTTMKTASTYANAGWPTEIWSYVDGSYPALVANPPPPPRSVTCGDGSMAEYEGVCPLRVDNSGVIDGPDCPP